MRLLISIFILCSFGHGLLAQSQNFLAPAVGFNAGHFKEDLSLMLSATSGYMVKQRFALRAQAGLRWMESYLSEKGRLIHYPAFQTGVVVNVLRSDRVSVYGEGGMNLVWTRSFFSEAPGRPGLYGQAGVELYIADGPSYGVIYFFETGYTLNNTHAEKLTGNPEYAHGFLVATGIRLHLLKLKYAH